MFFKVFHDSTETRMPRLPRPARPTFDIAARPRRAPASKGVLLSSALALAALAGAAAPSSAATGYVFPWGEEQYSAIDLRPHDGLAGGLGFYGGYGGIGSDAYSAGAATHGDNTISVFGTTGMAHAHSFYGVSGTLLPYSAVTFFVPYSAGLSPAGHPGESGNVSVWNAASFADSLDNDYTESRRTLGFGQTFVGTLAVTLVNDSSQAREFWRGTGFSMDLQGRDYGTQACSAPLGSRLVSAALRMVGR